jgi:pimeloyl-ACP methyl ester carboxylesterase
MDYISRVPLFPYRRQQFRPFYDNRSALADRCLGRGQDIARSMSTADVVRDLDLLRRAVGDTRLTYLGFSYGTYIGNTYANMFPRTIRALVIDGVLDPRLWSSGRQVRSDRVATQHEFAEFLRLCDRAGPQCAFSTPEGSRRRWDRLADRIRRAPVTLPDGSVYSYDFLVTDATFAMYDPETWGGTAGFGALFDSVADAALGGSAAAHRVSGLRRALLDRLRPPLAQAEEYDSLGAYYGNQCADTRYPRSFGAFRAIGAYAEAGSRFGPFWWWQNTPCARWPVAPDRYTGPWRTRTSAPVLVVGNYFDGITGYAGAKASARLLRGSRLLSYAGWGHTAYGRNPCTEAHVDRYLLSGTLPPVGTVCPANPNPFLTQTQRTSAGAPLVGRPPSWLVRH